MQRLLNPLRIDQCTQLAHRVGGQRRQGLIQGVLHYGGQNEKGSVMNMLPFYPPMTRCRLN